MGIEVKVLNEKNRYYSYRISLNAVNGNLVNMINNANYEFDGLCDNAIVSELNNCRNKIRSLQESILQLERSLNSLARKIEEENNVSD